LAPASLPSVTPPARDGFAELKTTPAVMAGTRSHPARPASAAPPPAAQGTAPETVPAPDPRFSAVPAIPPRAQARDQAGVTRAEKRTHAQDGADGPSAEPSPLVPTPVAAPNSTTPSLHIHHTRPGERAAVPEQGHTLPTREGKQAGEETHPSLQTQIAHELGQNGLRAEAQATTSLPQAQPPVSLPVHTQAGSGPTSAAAADPRLAAHLPAHAAPLAAQVAHDDGLSVTVLPHTARVAIESADGDLALHLRVQHGSAEITVGGSMAHLFETRAPEARAALASEGLALGHFDSGQQGGGQQGQPAPETPEASRATPAPYRPHQGPPLPATPADGRIHVTA